MSIILQLLHSEHVNLVKPQRLFHWYTQSHPVVNGAIVNATVIVIHTYIIVTQCSQQTDDN